MIKITFEEFFKSKEKLGIICKNDDQFKHLIKMSKIVLGKNIYEEEVCEEFAPWDYVWGNVGITFDNKGSYHFLEKNTKYLKLYEFDEVGEFKITEEGCERLLRHIFVGYSFRYNPERKTTTLYKCGKKVRVVNCHEEDKFDWKIGLALCLYRYKYMRKDLGVEYLKNELSIKKFAEYILRREFKFNEKQYDFFLKTVKEAEPYDEIYL